MIAGRPVHEILNEEFDDVVTRMVGRLRVALSPYDRMPAEAMRNDVTRISSIAVRAYIDWLRRGVDPTPAVLEQISRSAARRAEEGFPLESLIKAYVLGFEGILARLVDRAGPDDLAAVIALTRRITTFIKATTGAVASGYLTEVRAGAGDEHHARRSLLAALLSDGPREVTARAAGIDVAERYLVLSLAIDPHPDRYESRVNPTIVNRRMLRRLLYAFDEAGDADALASLDADGGTVLVPIMGDVDWVKWQEVIVRAAAVAGTVVRAAGEVATPREVAATARQTAEVLEVVGWLRRPTGLYRLDDVLVEFQLTRPGEARARLAGLLDPLVANPDLLTTLTTFVEVDLNRRRTASELHVHPNTIDYRLHRIAELTGLDPTRPGSTQQLVAAMAARSAETHTYR